MTRQGATPYPAIMAQSEVCREGRSGHGRPTMKLLEPSSKLSPSFAASGFVPRAAEGLIARHLLRPCFPHDREAMLLAAFDDYDRLIGIERADGDGIGRCFIPPRCWRDLLQPGVASVLMAHNHPSGSAWPSKADIGCTRECIDFLHFLGISLRDHLIFVDHGHFSFGQAQLI